VDQTRQQLVEWIADEALGGDKQVAEWLLLSLISRVYVVFTLTSLSIADAAVQPISSPAATPSLSHGIKLSIASGNHLSAPSIDPVPDTGLKL
jgi:hypothetical protein